MVRLLSAGGLLVALGLFVFTVSQLIRDVVADDEVAMANAMVSIHYAYPIVTFLYFVIASMYTVFTFKNLKAAKHPKTENRKKLVLGLSSGVILTFILNGILVLVRNAQSSEWERSTHENVYLLSSILIWMILQLSILDSTYIIWYPYSGCWYISIVSELLLLLLADLRRSHAPTLAGIGWIAITGLRIIALIMIPLLFYTLPATNNQPISPDLDEEQGLLRKQRESGVHDEPDANLGIYGSFFDTDSDDDRTKQTKKKLHAKWEESGNWWNYAKSFSVFWPMIWPSGNSKLQLYMFLIAVTLIGQSVLNVLVPRQFGLVTDSFMDATHGKDSSPWIQVSIFVVLKLLQSNAGLFAIKDYLWIPIEQYSYRMITTSAYNHILSLSYDFHCDKRSGELFASISNARSINWFIDMMLFRFLPMLADLFIAFVYLYYLFGAYMALLIAFVTVTFLWSTSKLANYNQVTRRDYIKASRKEGDTMWETVSNWQNISYFNNIAHEQNRYLGAVVDYQRFERRWTLGTAFLKILQSLIFTGGLLGACYLAVYAILEGTQPVGSFVTLLLYWTQLSGPLAFFADFFRRLNTSMIDAERVLEILSMKPTVANKKNAKQLEVKKGRVIFDDVHFAYDERKPALKGLSLQAKPGSTVAFVGETGGGKSTILRLLFRFYDVKKGSIEIDGQDIRDVTLESLRDAIGVVPQDPSMFNDTIMNNLRYANFDATDLDIYRACEAASIHSKILSFPDGYNSKVGERGVKLSGGELQRVAIARAILKNPKIILLDEATSMVDMETERKIQSAFKELAKGRTTFVVAHRLSTVVNADQIVVIQDGRIKEIGTHEELLRLQDSYYQLWNKQINTDGPEETKLPESKPILINDFSPKSRKTQMAKSASAAISQGLNTIVSTVPSTTQQPIIQKGVPTTKGVPPPQADLPRITKPASMPYYSYTMPTSISSISKLKATAPEYVPTAPISHNVSQISNIPFTTVSAHPTKSTIRQYSAYPYVKPNIGQTSQRIAKIVEQRNEEAHTKTVQTRKPISIEELRQTSASPAHLLSKGQSVAESNGTESLLDLPIEDAIFTKPIILAPAKDSSVVSETAPISEDRGRDGGLNENKDKSKRSRFKYRRRRSPRGSQNSRAEGKADRIGSVLSSSLRSLNGLDEAGSFAVGPRETPALPHGTSEIANPETPTLRDLSLSATQKMNQNHSPHSTISDSSETEKPHTK